MISIIKNPVDKYFGLFAYLLLYTGCRKGEALALQYRDIDRKNKVIHVTKSVAYKDGMPYLKTTKTDAGTRDIILLGELSKRLPRNGKADDYIFRQENGKPLAMAAFDRRWLHYCKEAGLVTVEEIPRVSVDGRKYVYKKYRPFLAPHQLRHGYATILYEAGIDEITAKEFLGHVDISTTHQIYTHLRQKKKSSAAEILDKYIKSIE